MMDDDSHSAVVPLSIHELVEKFPQYEILEYLGRGGMGVVYKARQKSLNRIVAIKVLAPERSGEARFAERFTHEAELLAKLSHPNIVTIHDFGETSGLYYFVMEFVDGVNLRDLLRDGKLAPHQALAIVPAICDALQFAHGKGIIHRDIKPENLLLDREGHVKIADFGIAKLITRQASIHEHATDSNNTRNAATMHAGTLGYIAPEQHSDPRHADHRADIYSLGVVLYEMLTGERPNQIGVTPTNPASSHAKLAQIIRRAMEKKPENRYQTAAEFRTVLQSALVVLPPEKNRRSKRRKKVIFRFLDAYPQRKNLFLIASTLLLVGTGFIMLWSGSLNLLLAKLRESKQRDEISIQYFYPAIVWFLLFIAAMSLLWGSTRWWKRKQILRAQQKSGDA